MPVVQMAILAELLCTKVRDAALTHPTMAEGLSALFLSAPSGVTRSASATA